MNISQKQQILDVIQSFKSNDFESAFVKKYSNTATIDSVQAGDYTVAELLALAQKAVLKLESRLQSEDWQILPLTQNLNEYGPVNLHSLLIHLTRHLTNAMYPQSATQIKALVYYEIQNGFWNMPQKIELGIRESSLDKLEQRASLMMKHIEERQNNINLLIDEVNSVKGELQRFSQEKKQEYHAIRQNHEESGRLLADIKNKEALAAREHTNITKINEQCDKVLKTLQEEQNAAKKQQAEINQQNADIQAANQQLKEEINDDLTQIRKTYDETTKYKEDIAKMMGFIADGTLAHSFHEQRKRKIWGIVIWGVCTGLSLIGLIGWIYAVFTYWPANTGNEWANIIINAIKSSPLAFLFGFALTHLAKNCNIKEEYAYREAIALTLTAYMEQLEHEDNPDKKSLLLQTVEKLYTKPILSGDESKSPIKIDSKDFTDIMSKLTDAVSAIKK